VSVSTQRFPITLFFSEFTCDAKWNNEKIKKKKYKKAFPGPKGFLSVFFLFD